MRSTSDPNALTPAPWTIAIAVGVLVAAVVFAFWDFFAVQWHYATKEPADWGHTLFVPLIALYVVSLHRAELLAKPLRGAASGFVFIVLGLAFYSLTTIGPDSTILNSHNARSLGVGLTLFGIAVALFGWRAMAWLWFPLLYLLFFGQRITDKLLLLATYPMQDAAAFLGWVVLDLIGYDVTRLGTTINVMLADGSTYPLDVAEACSGMRMLMAFLALGTVIAYVGLDRWWLRAVLVVLGIPIAIVINAFRIATLGVLSLAGNDYMVGEFHSFVGLVWMIPTFGLYMLMLWFLAPLGEDEDGASSNAAGNTANRPTPPAQFHPRIKLVGVATIALLLVGGLGLRAAMEALDRHLIKEAVPPRLALASLPSTLGDWTQVGKDAVFTDTVIEVLGTSRYLDRTYALNGVPSDGVIHLHVAYYTDLAGAAPHVPERCWEVHGGIQVLRPIELPLDVDRTLFRESDVINRSTGERYSTVTYKHPITGQSEEVPMPVGDLALRVTQFTTTERPDVHRIGGYFFLTNGRITPSARSVENLAFDLTSSHAYYCKIQLDMTSAIVDDGTAFRTRYQEQTSEFISHLLPFLMRVMPDWREYELPALEEKPCS
jgi:exosortase